MVKERNGQILIKFKERLRRKAEHFNKVFAKVSKSGKKTDLDRGLEKLLKTKLATETDDSNFIKEFTLAELEKQLRKLKKRKSPGPDKVHNEMLINFEEYRSR